MNDQVDLMMRVVAVAAYLLIGVVPFAGSGLVAPPAGVALLWAVWLGGWWMVIRWMRDRPKWAWVLSLVAVGVWIAIVLTGEALFGWSA